MRTVSPEAKSKILAALPACVEPEALFDLFDALVQAAVSSHVGRAECAIIAGVKDAPLALALAQATGPGGQVRLTGVKAATLQRAAALAAPLGLDHVFELHGGADTGALDELVPPEWKLRLIALALSGADIGPLTGAARMLRQWRPILLLRGGRTTAALANAEAAQAFFGFFESVDYALFDLLGFAVQHGETIPHWLPEWWFALPRNDVVLHGTLHGMIDDVLERRGLGYVVA